MPINQIRKGTSISIQSQFGTAFLDTVVDWIERNLKPDEVFVEHDLILWMRDNYSPEDVFTYDQLDEWANTNYDLEGKRG